GIEISNIFMRQDVKKVRSCNWRRTYNTRFTLPPIKIGGFDFRNASIPCATNARRTTMAKLNTLNLNFPPRTHEGAPARNISTELQLRRSVMACLLWESQFYEDGVEIAGRIAELVPKVAAEKVAALAIEAREQMKLRHVPLLLVREMARHKTHRHLVGDT